MDRARLTEDSSQGESLDESSSRSLRRRPRRWYHLRSYDQRLMIFLEAETANPSQSHLLHDFIGTTVRGRYELLGKLGSGAFGVVFKVKDLWTKKLKALKICKNERSALVEVEREAATLSKLKKLGDVNKSNIVRLYTSFSCAGRQCLVTEFLQMTLDEYIYDYHLNGMNLSQVKQIAYELMVALSFLEEHKIVHCDLKPQNIMMQDTNTLKIKVIDFGSSEHVDVVGRFFYLQTRYYRAPEVLLNYFPVTQAVDMWSAGCVIAECYIGSVMFQGSSQREQIREIVKVLGQPPASMLPNPDIVAMSFANGVLTETDYRIMRQDIMRIRKYVPLNKFLEKPTTQPDEQKLLFSLISSLLTYLPHKRMKASMAKRQFLFRDVDK